MELVTSDRSDQPSVVAKSPANRKELVEKADAASRKRGAVAVADLPADPRRPQVIYWDTKLTGFGVVVSRSGARTFIAEGRLPKRAGGKKRRKAVGIHGRASGEGAQVWTVASARQRAREILGQIENGIDPNRESRERLDGPTLRDALETHVSNMRKRGRSPRSIATIEAEIPRLMKMWIDRPLIDLKGPDLVALHDKITTDHGPFLANRLVAHVSAVWNATDRVHELEGRNPARAVTRHRYVPKRERIDNGELPAWWTKVQALSAVRRDLRVFCLSTGMRDEAARHVRWEHLDFKAGALTVPKPKGGEAKAFVLPIGPRLLARLKERKRENAVAFAPHGGDHGWVFPTTSRRRDTETGRVRVIALRESKEYRENEKGERERLLVGNHASRRTYLSVATELGIGELDRHALANHAFGRQSVNATYIAQAFDHLAGVQAKIEDAIWARLERKSLRRRRS